MFPGVILRLPPALAATVLWAYGLTSLVPNEYAENNTYWMRDMRWAAIVAAVGLLIAASRSRWAALAAPAWIAADIVLDRLNVTAFIPTAVIAGALVTLLFVFIPGRPSERRLLTVAAAVCAATAPLLALLESPTDTEAALAPTRLAAAALLTVAALACALTAAPSLNRWRFGGAVFVAAVPVTLWAIRPNGLAGALTPAVVLLAGVWLLSRPWPGWASAAAHFAGILVGYPTLAFMIFFSALELGRPFTALAGNPEVNPADSDISYCLIGVMVGLLVGYAPKARDLLATALADTKPLPSH